MSKADEIKNKAECCICHKEIKNVKKTENYCCDKCWEKYVINNK